MKRIRIPAGKIGLVYRNGSYSRTIVEGVYWVFPYESVTEHEEGDHLKELKR